MCAVSQSFSKMKPLSLTGFVVVVILCLFLLL